MAEDNILDNENIFDDQINGQENNNSGDMQGASDDSEVRTFIYLDGQFKGQRDELLVNKVETTSTEEDSLVETTEIRFKTPRGADTCCTQAAKPVLHACPARGVVMSL